jgi:hypothetical protein
VTWRGAILWLCAAIAAQLCLTSPARAAPRRIAVIVGNNVGHGDDRPLRYAERDASRVAAVFRELGRFDDVTVVLGRDAGVALSSLAAARLRASSYRAAGDTVLFAFYYSGHGSRDSRLDFAALQAEVRALAADVRFLIVDACEAGALTRGKGLRARSPVT